MSTPHFHAFSLGTIVSRPRSLINVCRPASRTIGCNTEREDCKGKTAMEEQELCETFSEASSYKPHRDSMMYVRMAI